MSDNKVYMQSLSTHKGDWFACPVDYDAMAAALGGEEFRIADVDGFFGCDVPEYFPIERLNWLDENLTEQFQAFLWYDSQWQTKPDMLEELLEACDDKCAGKFESHEAFCESLCEGWEESPWKQYYSWEKHWADLEHACYAVDGYYFWY